MIRDLESDGPKLTPEELVERIEKINAKIKELDEEKEEREKNPQNYLAKFIRAFVYADYTLSLVSHQGSEDCNEDIEGSCKTDDEGKMIQECPIRRYLLEVRDNIHNPEMPTYNNISLYLPWMKKEDQDMMGHQK